MADKGGGGTTVSNTSLPEWVQPYAQGYLNQATDVASQPYQAYQGQRVADLAPTTQQGVQNLGNLASGTPSMWAADQMLGQTLSGEGMNPYLGAMSDRIVGDAGRAYQANTGAITQRFNGAGNFGGSAHMGAQSHANQDFARGVGDSLSQLYSGGYENERNRQMQAVGASTGLANQLGQSSKDAISAGGLESAHQQQLLDSLYGDFTQWRDYPEHQLGIMGNTASTFMGGGAGQQTTTNGPGGDPLGQGMGYLMLANLMGWK